MSSTHPHSRGFPKNRNVARVLLLAAVASASALAGCESAMDHTSTDRGSARYAESLVARSIMDNNYHGDLVQSPTVAQGVRELPRVDSTGPATAPADVVSPTNVSPSNMTIPTSQPAADTTLPNDPFISNDLGNTSPAANDVGNSAAALNAPEKVFNLSLQDAIARTLKNALDIKTQSYSPAITESQLIQQEAVFDPELFGNSNVTSTNEPALINSFSNGIPPKPIVKNSNNVLNGLVVTNQLGIRQLLPTGTSAQVSAGLTYRDLSNGAGTGVPTGYSYAPNLNATITQPLLRGFGTNVNEANISITQRDHRISLEAFRRQVITSVSNVEEAYHNLTLARTTVAIQERLLVATEDTYKRVNDRILVDADQISVNQAIAAVEQRRAELINDRMALRQASDRLKSLINDPELDVSDNTLINPSDKPIAEPIVFSTAESILTALQQRTELQEDRLKLEQIDIRLVVAKNDLLPQLDITASVQANGLEKDLEPAFGSTVNGNFIDYAAGIRLTFPIGNRAAEAEVRQRKLERNQELTQIVSDAQQVVLDVKNQLRELLGRYPEVQERELARISAAKELKAITDKEKIVALTPEFLQLKLDSQSRLAAAEQSLIQAIINYNLAIMRLERAKGTLLEFDRISLNRAPIARPDDDYGKIRFLDRTYTLTK